MLLYKAAYPDFQLILYIFFLTSVVHKRRGEANDNIFVSDHAKNLHSSYDISISFLQFLVISLIASLVTSYQPCFPVLSLSCWLDNFRRGYGIHTSWFLPLCPFFQPSLSSDLSRDFTSSKSQIPVLWFIKSYKFCSQRNVFFYYFTASFFLNIQPAFIFTPNQFNSTNIHYRLKYKLKFLESLYSNIKQSKRTYHGIDNFNTLIRIKIGVCMSSPKEANNALCSRQGVWRVSFKSNIKKLKSCY